MIDYYESEPKLEEEEDDPTKEDEPDSSSPSLEVPPSLPPPSHNSFRLHIIGPKMENTPRKTNLIPSRKRSASHPSSPVAPKNSCPAYDVGESSRVPPPVHVLETLVEEAIYVLVPRTTQHSKRIHTIEEELRSMGSEVRHLFGRIMSLEEDYDLKEMSLQNSYDQLEVAQSYVQAY